MSHLLKRMLVVGSLAGGALLLSAGAASAQELSVLDHPKEKEAQEAVTQAQTATNTNTTSQDASASASTSQANVHVPVSVLCAKCNNGDVSQSNDADTTAVAVNKNDTSQGVQRGQFARGSGSGCGRCGGGATGQSQEAENGNRTDQRADANATTYQANVAVPVAVACYDCNNGNISQSNDADTTAVAANRNSTEQGIAQSQGATGTPCGSCGRGGGTRQAQEGSNCNETRQDATANAGTYQANVAVPIAILCASCNNGDVNESNDAETTAVAANQNRTRQGILQDQSADGGRGGVSQSQSATNRNRTDQRASADATTRQANVAVPVSVLCVKCNNGDVRQSNRAETTAVATNRNATSQGIGQSQRADGVAFCGCPPGGEADKGKKGKLPDFDKGPKKPDKGKGKLPDSTRARRRSAPAVAGSGSRKGPRT